jgi:hypothetical protein
LIDGVPGEVLIEDRLRALYGAEVETIQGAARQQRAFLPV